jgi:multidrug transporter EmrE-like cation transporter
MPAWLLLGFAILAEVAGTLALRASDGFSRPLPSAIVVVGYGAAFWLMALVLREISVSVTYAVWSGVGTALIATIGMTMLGEPVSALKVLSLAAIVAGVVGLNAGGAH